METTDAFNASLSAEMFHCDQALNIINFNNKEKGWKNWERIHLNIFKEKNCQWSLTASLQRIQGNIDHSPEEVMDDERNPKGQVGRKEGGKKKKIKTMRI